MAKEKNELAISLENLERFKKGLPKAAQTGSYNDLEDKPTIPTVPGNVGAFNNDAGYINATEAASIAATEAKLKKEIVVTLPAAGSADTNTLYLILNPNGEGDDIYDEYMLIGGKLEKIGSTQVLMDGVLTEDDIATDADIDALFEEEE